MALLSGILQFFGNILYSASKCTDRVKQSKTIRDYLLQTHFEEELREVWEEATNKVVKAKARKVLNLMDCPVEMGGQVEKEKEERGKKIVI